MHYRSKHHGRLIALTLVCATLHEFALRQSNALDTHRNQGNAIDLKHSSRYLPTSAGQKKKKKEKKRENFISLN